MKIKVITYHEQTRTAHLSERLLHFLHHHNVVNNCFFKGPDLKRLSGQKVSGQRILEMQIKMSENS